MNTQTKTPSVSVCIPTYRGAAHLSATVESILTQTYTDFELVIVDDNSPDETADIVAQFKDPRIRYLKNSVNLGPEGNWNRCLQEARGKYFKLLPQDDLLYPDTLQRQVDILERDREELIALVFGARNIIDLSGKIIAKRGYPRGRDGMITAEQLVRQCVRYGTNLIGEPGAVLMRKRLAERIGLFDGSIGYVIDLDYWVRLLSNGNGYYLEKTVSAFRVYSGSWSVAIGKRQSEAFCAFINKLENTGGWRLSCLDKVTGKLMASINNLLRLIFYRFVLKRGTQ